MSVTIAEEGNPEQMTFTDEQIAAMRSALLDGYDEKVSRRNPVIFRASAAAELLDERGFDWGRALDDAQKYWGVVWMTRAIMGLRRSYRNTRPMFVEVF